MGKSYPYYPAMRPSDLAQAVKLLNDQKVPFSSPFDPAVWSSEIKNAFGYSSRFLRKMLDPNSIWAPTGEDYEEPVAWAKLLGVTVFTSYELSGPTIFLNKPGCVTKTLSACSPADLSAAIRDYAQNAKAPQVDDE